VQYVSGIEKYKKSVRRVCMDMSVGKFLLSGVSWLDENVLGSWYSHECLMSVWLVSRIVPADWIEEELPEHMKMVAIIELRKARICCRGNGR